MWTLLYIYYIDFELGFLNGFVIQKNYVGLQIDIYISTVVMRVLTEVEALKARFF